jgi:carboxylesterase
MADVQREKPWPRDPETGIIRGAEPFTFGSGSQAILFLHGWTSTPRELRFLAERCAAAGFHCHGPLLKGHGTRLEDLSPTRFSDYLKEAEAAFDTLAAKYERVWVCGLSMGGLLGLTLATERPVAGLLLVAPFIFPTGKTFGLPNRWLIGRVPLWGDIAKSAGGPIRDPAALEGHIAYHAMPAHSMVSVVVAARRFVPRMRDVHCPVLILHSLDDATSDFSGSRLLMERLGTEDKSLVTYDVGNHIITLDYPRKNLEETTLEWLTRRSSPNGKAQGSPARLTAPH